MTSETHADSARLYDMMARLGIDQDTVGPSQLSLWFETALQRCGNCQAKTACRDWLGCTRPAAVAPWFCVNADILFELQYDQLGPRRVN